VQASSSLLPKQYFVVVVVVIIVVAVSHLSFRANTAVPVVTLSSGSSQAVVSPLPKLSSLVRLKDFSVLFLWVSTRLASMLCITSTTNQFYY